MECFEGERSNNSTNLNYWYRLARWSGILDLWLLDSEGCCVLCWQTGLCLDGSVRRYICVHYMQWWQRQLLQYQLPPACMHQLQVHAAIIHWIYVTDCKIVRYCNAPQSIGVIFHCGNRHAIIETRAGNDAGELKSDGIAKIKSDNEICMTFMVTVRRFFLSALLLFGCRHSFLL